MLSVPLVGLNPAALHAETPDISGLEWTLDSTITIQVKKAGKDTQKGQSILYIGPNLDEGLIADQWKMIDPDGDELSGTYHEKADKPGKGFFHLEPANLSAYLLIKLETFAADGDVTDLAIGAPQGNLYPKVMENKKGLTFTLNSKIKVDVSATVEGTPESSSTTLTLKLKGTRPPEPLEQDTEGARWFFNTTNTFKIKGLQKITDDGDADIILGPNQDRELASNEFIGMDQGVELLRGTYTRNKKKITFTGPDLENHLKNIVEEYAVEALLQDPDNYSVTDVQAEITNLKMTATIKSETSGTIDIKLKFNGSAVVNGEYGEGKGSFIVKGDGAPVL